MANTDAKTPANVAGLATQADAMNRRTLSLLGLYGPEDNLTALVRLPSGRTRKVTRGTRISGAQVVAIDAEGLVLNDNGTAKRIAMPGG